MITYVAFSLLFWCDDHHTTSEDSFTNDFILAIFFKFKIFTNLRVEFQMIQKHQKLQYKLSFHVHKTKFLPL